MRGGWLAFWLVVGVAVFSSGPARGDLKDSVVSIHLEGPVTEWLLDESSGRLFAALSDQKVIAELDPATGEEIRRFELPVEAKRMVIKENRLAVALKVSNPSLTVFNLETNQFEKHVQLRNSTYPSVPGTFAMFRTQAANPYIYVLIYGDAKLRNGVAVVQVDIRNYVIRKQMGLPHVRQKEVLSVIPSADGKHVLFDYGPEKGVALMEFDEEEFAFKELIDYHFPFGPKTAGPANRYWMLGSRLFPLDLIPDPEHLLADGPPEGLRTFAGEPARIHPKYDLVVSVGGPAQSEKRSLEFQTFTGAEAIDRIEISLPVPSDSASEPPPLGPSLPNRNRPSPNRPEEKESDQPTLQFDVVRDRLLCAQGSVAHIVDLNGLSLSGTPLVVFDLPGSLKLSPGQELRVPLKLTSEELTSRAKFDITDPPPGMHIEDGSLVWKPGLGDVGLHRITVGVEVDGRQSTTTLAVLVERLFLNLGIFPAKMSIDSSGKRALILGNKNPPKFLGRIPDDESTELMLVDVDSLAILGRQTLDEPVRDILLTDSAAYAISEKKAPGDKETQGSLFAFRVEDLTPSETVPLPETPRTLQYASPERLVLGMGEKQGSCLLRTNPLQPVLVLHGASDDAETPRNFENAVQVGNLLLDARTGRPCLVRDAPGLYQLNRSNSNLKPTVPGWWGRELNSGRLVIDPRRYNPNSITNGSLPGNDGVIARDIPAVIVMRIRQPQDLSPPHSPLPENALLGMLEVRDLNAGTIIQQIELCTFLNRSRAPVSEVERNIVRLVGVAGRRVIVCIGPTLGAAEIPESVVEQLPEPLRFLPRTSRVEVPVGKPETIEVSARGGKGKIQFRMLNPSPGIRINSRTGELTLDTQTLWQSLPKNMSENVQLYVNRTPTQSYVKNSHSPNAARTNYKALTGQETDQYPAVVHVDLQATDEAGQNAFLTFKILLLGPIPETKLDRSNSNSNPNFNPNSNSSPQIKQMVEASTRATREAVERGEQERIMNIGAFFLPCFLLLLCGSFVVTAGVVLYWVVCPPKPGGG